jgi:hypothetical protein
MAPNADVAESATSVGALDKRVKCKVATVADPERPETLPNEMLFGSMGQLIAVEPGHRKSGSSASPPSNKIEFKSSDPASYVTVTAPPTVVSAKFIESVSTTGSPGNAAGASVDRARLFWARTAPASEKKIATPRSAPPTLATRRLDRILPGRMSPETRHRRTPSNSHSVTTEREKADLSGPLCE